VRLGGTGNRTDWLFKLRKGSGVPSGTPGEHVARQFLSREGGGREAKAVSAMRLRRDL
jgi:hypothetical protein